MRRLGVALLLLLLTGSPASAYLVEVTTSVAVADAGDRSALQTALMSAVDDVLSDAIAFTPTLIVLTHAALVGDRLYIRLLLADQDGEKTFDVLRNPAEPPATPTELKI